MASRRGARLPGFAWRCEGRRVLQERSRPGSFFAESDEGICTGRTLGRKVAGEERDARKNGGHGKEGGWIGWPHLKKHGSEHSRHDYSSRHTKDQPDDDDPHAFSQRHAQNVVALSAESDSDSDFLHALAERIRHHAVDPGSGKQQRYCRKNTKELKSEPPVRHGSCDDLIHGTDAVHGNIGIDAFHLAPHSFAQLFRVALTTKKNHRVHWSELPKRYINVRDAGSLEPVRLDIANHADNREPLQTSSKPKLNLLSDRILARPILPEGLVDDGNGLRFVCIGGGKISPVNQRNFHGVKVLRIDHSDVCNRSAL